MPTIHLIHWLQEHCQAQAQSCCDEHSSRYIIYIHNMRQYQIYWEQLKQLYSSPQQTQWIQALPSSLSFACSLNNVEPLLSHPHVRSIEKDRKINQMLSFSRDADKPRSSKPLIPWGIRRVKAPLVWQHTAGASVSVGVIDTGIDYSHPDLQHRIAGGINLIQRAQPPFDDNGHGTHMAGIIAASAQSDGIVGMAPRASLYAIKAFDHLGTAYVSDIASGIEWCIQNRIPIINMSFGMKQPSRLLRNTVQAAYHAGIVIVASSGNQSNSRRIDYPARYPQTISVGATTTQTKIAPFSNRGRHVTIYAPGHHIYSTWLNHQYHDMSGTSMATSHISGMIALMLSYQPALSIETIRKLLTTHATRITSKKRQAFPCGEANVYAMIQALINTANKNGK